MKDRKINLIEAIGIMNERNWKEVKFRVKDTGKNKVHENMKR